MKKSFLILRTAVILAGCHKDELLLCGNEVSTENENIIKKRTPEEALHIAAEAAKMLEDSTMSRTLSRIPESVKVITSPTARSKVEDTLIYVVDYADDKGFALISAISVSDPLLAIIEDGHYEPSQNSIQESGFDMFMDYAKTYVLSCIYNESRAEIKPTNPGLLRLRTQVDTIVNTTLWPRIKVKWGQDNPEGMYCPNKVSGCVPTAIAMALSYYEHPQFLYLTYPNCMIDMLKLDWVNIKNHIINHNYVSYIGKNCMASESAHDKIARLCRQIGEKADTDYSKSGVSSTLKRKIRGTLSFFLPARISEWSDYNSDSLYEAVHARNGIALMDGRLVGAESGHCWICDGYIYRQCRIRYYTSSDGIFWNLENTDYVSDLYFHYNWGHNGRNNGYFKDKIFRQSGTTLYDSGKAGEWFNSISYQYEQIQYLSIK